jgi:hypothetical protein
VKEKGEPDAQRTWLLFPVVWLLFMALACILRVQVVFAGILSVVCGVICYGLTLSVPRSKSRSARWGVAVRIAVIVGIFVLSLSATRTYYWISWNPVGNAYDDGWGWFFPDSVDELSDVSKVHGRIVTIKRTRDLLIADRPIPYFVFIRKPGEQSDAGNLVFRYDTTDRGWNRVPTIHWLNGSSVLLSVEPGTIAVITKQLAKSEGVGIKYDLGNPTYKVALHFWQRPFF